MAISHTLCVLIVFVALGSPIAFAEKGGDSWIGVNVAPNIDKFCSSASGMCDLAATIPSLAIQPPLPNLGPIRGSNVVQFSQDAQTFRASVSLRDNTSVYGLGEHPGPLLRQDRQFVTWNTDAFAYDSNTNKIYQSHPYLLCVQKDGSAIGIIADTPFRLTISISNETVSFASAAIYRGTPAPFNVYIIWGDSPQEVTRTLSKITGYMPLPPKWALGYQQCRWSYYPDTRVKEIASGFRERNIPCDVIWLDIDYMDGFRIFTFDPERFPDPKGLNDYLHGLGFHSVWMIDPGAKQDPGYFVHDQMVAKNLAVLFENGTIYSGEVWPGPCVFPDYTMEETQAWWAGLYKDFLSYGIDGVWNDMNEPAVFEKTKTMPVTNIHRGLGGGDHAMFHNLYGMLMINATRNGILAAKPDKRPFVLSRSNYLGGHRYGATWTGDNVANWEHLYLSIPMVLNLGISGQPFSGPDIGGFAGNSTPALFARWMGFGALLPFARAHKVKGAADSEPWSFGPAVEETCRTAINRRYMLLPYYYTTFFETSTIGLPVMRPLFFADPKDPALRSEDRAFTIGADLLVVVNVDPDGAPPSKPVSMPKNSNWYPLDLDDSKDPDLPKMFIRGGAIIPTQEVVQYVDETPLNDFSLYIALDSDLTASGRLYNDAGDGFEYTDGVFYLLSFKAALSGNKLVVDIIRKGLYPIPSGTVTLNVYFNAEVIKKTVPFTGDRIVVPLF